MPPKSQTPKGKILNPDTNRYVGVDTKKGKELLASAAKASPKKKAKSGSEKKTLTKPTKPRKQKTIDVVIHPEHGSFHLSEQAIKLYEKKSGKNFRDLDDNNEFLTHEEVKYRSDPNLISVIRKLGTKAIYAGYGRDALEIMTIPAIFKDCFKITEHGGAEDLDISSGLLAEHILKTTNIKEMTPEESKKFLLKLQKTINTEYDYDKIEPIGDRKLMNTFVQTF